MDSRQLDETIPQMSTIEDRTGKGRPFVGVRFRCCNTYARAYMNTEGSAFEARCPKCGVKSEWLAIDFGSKRGRQESP